MWHRIKPKWQELIGELQRRGAESESAIVQQTKSGLPPETESQLSVLWADNTLSHDDIGARLGYDGDTIRKIGYKLGLPKRKVGRKSGK